MKNAFTFIDLFAGAGGFGVGFSLAGFNQLLSLEQDKFACKTLLQNNNHKIVQADITQFSSKSKILNLMDNKSPDVIIGGPPCQGFSNAAGKKLNKDDSRNSLVNSFMFWVECLKPKVFVIENVPGILTKKNLAGKAYFERIKENSKKSGYSINVWKLNAADYGVPQLRNRVFIIGTKEKLFDLDSPNPTYFPLISSNKKKYITVEEAILDLPVIYAKQGEEIMNYSKAPFSKFQKWARKKSKYVFNHVAMNHTERLVRRYELIQKGESELPDKLKVRKRNGKGEISQVSFNQNYRHLNPKSISYTIPASFYSSFVHPTLPRNITAREAARLQSFPDNYKFEGSRTLVSSKLLKKLGKEHLIGLSQYNQVGNAVPPLLAKAVAKRILEIIS